jgi:Flp pilus assembly protein TadD
VAAPVSSPPASAPQVPGTSGPALTAETHQQRGRDLTAAGKFPQAIAELSESIRLKPNVATAWNARGYAYLRAGDSTHAIADFDEAIRLNPAYTNALRNRAAAKRATGDRAGAAADLEKAASLERH